ncbi:MAG: hypothetical protein KDK23_03565 [Leptospiraceae bacterium]|nr:hypothetical protein [Leptospiraceae bacterium]
MKQSKPLDDLSSIPPNARRKRFTALLAPLRAIQMISDRPLPEGATKEEAGGRI